MSKAQWQAVKAGRRRSDPRMAALDRRPPATRRYRPRSPGTTPGSRTSTPASAEVYRGLGQLYTENPEFRANYDKYRTGLADFMQAAMAYYADHTLAKA